MSTFTIVFRTREIGLENWHFPYFLRLENKRVARNVESDRKFFDFWLEHVIPGQDSHMPFRNVISFLNRIPNFPTHSNSRLLTRLSVSTYTQKVTVFPFVY